MKIMAAPLQGYTDVVWRHFHAEIYGGIDTYFTPFMRVEHGVVRPRDLRGIISPLNDNNHIVPQILFRDVDEFDVLVDAVTRLGYREIDLNLGCPFLPQVKHGRGAALLLRSDTLKVIRERIIAKYHDVSFSAKIRLGVSDAHEWRDVIEQINLMPLSHLTVHPRIACQQYSGALDMEQFGEILSASVHPVIYNGDLVSVGAVRDIVNRYSQLDGIMIGRGLLSRPSLAAEWDSGTEMAVSDRIAAILQFHSALFDYYSDNLCGEAQILSKIKPFWDYLEEEIGRKTAKAIRKSTSINKYLSALQNI